MELKIEPVANGWIVRAGCLRLVFTDRGILSSEFSRWLIDQKLVEGEYAKKYDTNPLGIATREVEEVERDYVTRAISRKFDAVKEAEPLPDRPERTR